MHPTVENYCRRCEEAFRNRGTLEITLGDSKHVIHAENGELRLYKMNSKKPHSVFDTVEKDEFGQLLLVVKGEMDVLAAIAEEALQQRKANA